MAVKPVTITKTGNIPDWASQCVKGQDPANIIQNFEHLLRRNNSNNIHTLYQEAESKGISSEFKFKIFFPSSGSEYNKATLSLLFSASYRVLLVSMLPNRKWSLHE